MRKTVLMAGIISLGFVLSSVGCAGKSTPGQFAEPKQPSVQNTQSAKETAPPIMVNIDELMERGVKYLDAGDYLNGIKTFQEILVSTDKPEVQAVSYYNIACAYSLLKEKAPALEYLEKALRSGYTDEESIDQDKDLTYLRNMPEYRALMAKIPQMTVITEIPPTAQDDQDEQEAVRLIEETHKLKYKEIPKYKILVPDQFAKAFGGDASSIQGFYRWSDKTLYIKQGANPVRFKATRIHESFHALQDQLFGMGEMQKNVKTTDEKYALTGVIEGDATLIFIECMTDSGNARMMLNPALLKMMSAGEPRYDNTDKGEAALRMKLFNYSIGARFIDEVKKAKGWEGVNAIYTHLPASTEQILHPEKYLQQNDPPIPVVIPDLSAILGAEWKMSQPDVQGEFAIMLNLLTNPRSGPNAEEAAAGWGGDTFVTLEKKERKDTFAIHKTVWDTPKDAQEFFNAICLALQDTNQPEKGDNYVSYKRADNKMDYVMIQDKMVLVIYNIPQDLNEKVVKAVVGDK